MIGKTEQSFGNTKQMGTLTELLSSNVKAEVFRLLFGLDGGPLHLPEIERRSGLAVATVQQELKRLTRLGAIEARPDGKRTHYGARVAHPSNPERRGWVMKDSG